MSQSSISPAFFLEIVITFNSPVWFYSNGQKYLMECDDIYFGPILFDEYEYPEFTESSWRRISSDIQIIVNDISQDHFVK